MKCPTAESQLNSTAAAKRRAALRPGPGCHADAAQHGEAGTSSSTRSSAPSQSPRASPQLGCVCGAPGRDRLSAAGFQGTQTHLWCFMSGFRPWKAALLQERAALGPAPPLSGRRAPGITMRSLGPGNQTASKLCIWCFFSLGSSNIVKIHVWVLSEKLPAFPDRMFWSLQLGLGCSLPLGKIQHHETFPSAGQFPLQAICCRTPQRTTPQSWSFLLALAWPFSALLETAEPRVGDPGNWQRA